MTTTMTPTHPTRRRVAGLLATAPLALAAALSLHLPAQAQGAETPRHGGTVRYIIPVNLSSLIPLTTSSGGNIDIGPKVNEGLLTYDRQLNPKPQLATAWTVSRDGLQYRFSLRPGVKWHDGRDFTSADVAFSLQTLSRTHPRGRQTLSNITAIQTPDAHTVVLVLNKPAPYLITALSAAEAPIIARHLYEGTDPLTSKYNSAPVGTGPFVFKEWVQGSHVTLERNPNYWDKGKPYLDRLVFRFIPDVAARAATLEAGEAEFGNGAVALADVERLRKLPNLVVNTDQWPYWGNHQQLYFNFEHPVLKNREVRRAIAQALDLQAYNRLVWFGQGVLSASPLGKAQTTFHDPSIKHQPYDPKAAEALLDAAGHKRGPNGTRFTLRLLYNSFLERRTPEFIRQQLAKVGIDAVIESYDIATYVKKVYTDRAFDITAEGLTNLFDPTVGVQRVFWSKNFKIGLPFSNASHYDNPEADRLLEAAADEADTEKRRQLWFAFQKLIAEDVASVEFGANPNITVVSKKLRNYADHGEGSRNNFAETWLAP